MTTPDTFNVRISAFDDLGECRQAVASVPDGIPIHIFDGRYCTFDGDYDLTPGLEAFCETQPDCTYHAPDADRLPFGHDLDVPTEWRPGNHAKARWINYEQLPPDEWSLKLDTDERLDRLELPDSLDPRTRYSPEIVLHGDETERAHVERLWQPREWTCWIDDCLLPRAIFPRDTPLDILQRIWREDRYRVIRMIGWSRLGTVRIDNYGAERDPAYQQRRVDHLRRIGRTDRWADLDGRLSEE